MSDELTKESEKLLLQSAKYVLTRRKRGIGRLDSKLLGSPENIQKYIAPELSLEDIEDISQELVLKDYFQIEADYLGMKIEVTDKAIIYIENRFKNNINQIIEFISKLK